MIRSERLAEQGFAESGVETRSEVDSTDDIERRKIVVRRTFRFATPEDLARSVLRNATRRRPRRFNETRLLLRLSGPIRACGQACDDRSTAHGLVRQIRPGVKQCIIDEQAQRSEVLVKAPAALVLEQLPGALELEYVFSVYLEPGAPARIAGNRTISESARACMAKAVNDVVSGSTHGQVEIPLVAFVESAKHDGSDPLHLIVSRQAAALGWLHFERGEYEDALGYFRDAYWSFHDVEYQVLIGMALERLGRFRGAVEAYTRYVEERRHAPDAPALRAKIASLQSR